MDIQDMIEDWKKQTEDTTYIFESKIAAAYRADVILSEAQQEFKRLSSIFNKKDITFLVIACILHGCSKIIIRKMRRMKDSDLAKINPFHSEEHSNRANKMYYCSREEIITNPVPFDAIVLDGMYKQSTAPRPGFSGLNHRVSAIGHDPFLGLLIGTANIMTGTITRNDFRSWHVNTELHERTQRNGNTAMVSLDTICQPASTPIIFMSVFERIQKEGKEGWITLGTALAKEVVHLMTDLPSSMSLPLPLISSISPDFARRLSIYGFNTGTYLEGCVATKLINFIIAFMHRLCMDSESDEKAYQARTNKIVAYSDIIATSGDLAVTMYQSYLGHLSSMRKFDLGGYIVTLDKLAANTRLINRIECEYMINKLDKQLLTKREI